MQIPKQVLVTDVVARDGFQNEDRIVSAKENKPCHCTLRLRRY